MSFLHKKLLPIFPFVAYAAVTATVFANVLFLPKEQLLFAPDIWRYHYYTKPFLFQQLSKGIFPLWNPYTFSGQPYVEHPQSVPWYPLGILFAFLPAGTAISWYMALHILIAMTSMYIFIRSLRVSEKKSIDRFSAWIGGAVFGLSGFFMARVYAGHFDLIAASAWTPLVLAMFLRLLRSPSRKAVALAGIVLAIQIVAGYQTITLFTLLALCILGVLVTLSEWSARPLVLLFTGVFLGLGISAIQLFPTYQFVLHSIRQLPLPESWAVVATPTPQHLLELIDPFFFYDMIPKISFGHEFAAYIGKVPLLFAISTILFLLHKRLRSPQMWWLVILPILAWWIALGPNAPIDIFSFMRRFVPLYSSIRIPSRHLLLYVLGMSALAAYSIQFVKKRIVQIVIALFIFIDLLPIARSNVHIRQIPELDEDPELVSLLTGDKSLYRFLPDYFPGDLVRENFEFDAPLVHNIFSVSGYDQPPLRNYWEFLLAVNNVDISETVPYMETTPPFRLVNSPFTNFLNIKYVFVPTSADPLSADVSGRFRLVLNKESRGYRLYENTQVLPRFYMVSKLTEFPRREEIVGVIKNRVIDPRETVLALTGASPIVSREAICKKIDIAPIEVISYTPNSITLTSNNHCDGYLVTSEVMYPGWEAYIDGKPASLFEGNLAFRTLFVPEGNHTITMKYFPKIFIVSALISFIFIVASTLFLATRL